MSQTPSEIVQALLKEPTNLKIVSELVAPDATYVSLNYENAELKKIMPWAGTAKGPQAVVDTYTRVGQYWESKDFQIEDIVESEGNVAVIGRFTYKSNTLGKTITSPFCIFAKVRGGQIVYMQFMEDTFGTAFTFRTTGAGTFHSDPNGPEITL